MMKNSQRLSIKQILLFAGLCIVLTFAEAVEEVPEEVIEEVKCGDDEYQIGEKCEPCFWYQDACVEECPSFNESNNLSADSSRVCEEGGLGTLDVLLLVLFFIIVVITFVVCIKALLFPGEKQVNNYEKAKDGELATEFDEKLPTDNTPIDHVQDLESGGVSPLPHRSNRGLLSTDKGAESGSKDIGKQDVIEEKEEEQDASFKQAIAGKNFQDIIDDDKKEQESSKNNVFDPITFSNSVSKAEDKNKFSESVNQGGVLGDIEEVKSQKADNDTKEGDIDATPKGGDGDDEFEGRDGKKKKTKKIKDMAKSKKKADPGIGAVPTHDEINAKANAAYGAAPVADASPEKKKKKKKLDSKGGEKVKKIMGGMLKKKIAKDAEEGGEKKDEPVSLFGVSLGGGEEKKEEVKDSETLAEVKEEGEKAEKEGEGDEAGVVKKKKKKKLTGKGGEKVKSLMKGMLKKKIEADADESPEKKKEAAEEEDDGPGNKKIFELMKDGDDDEEKDKKKLKKSKSKNMEDSSPQKKVKSIFEQMAEDEEADESPDKAKKLKKSKTLKADGDDKKKLKRSKTVEKKK